MTGLHRKSQKLGKKIKLSKITQERQRSDFTYRYGDLVSASWVMCAKQCEK